MEQRVFYTYRYDAQRRKRIATIAFIKSEESISIGVALCSLSDQFEKRIGRLISNGRLMQHLQTGSTQNGYALTATYKSLGLSDKPQMSEIVAFLRENVNALTGTSN